MAYVTSAVVLSLASLTAIVFAQSVNGSASLAPSWTWPYLQVYPPVTADESAGRTKSLYFALMMSFSGNAKTSGTIPGVQAALDGINSDPTLLPGYKLHYTLTDSQCNRTVALDAFFKQIVHHPVKIAWIGSGCSVATTPTAEISHQYNITQISCISATPELGHHQRFPYYFQMQPTAEQLGLEFFAIVKQFQWKRVAIIEQNENLFTVAMARLKVLLTQAGINFTNCVFNTEEGIEGLGPQPFNQQSRIFIIASYSQHARQLLCKAYHLGMRYPHHMFVSSVSYAGRWWEVAEEGDECTPEQRKSVLNYTLAITQQFDFHSDPNATTDTGINGNQYNELYKAHQDSSPLDVDKNRTNVYSQHCYDATWALALALNKTITELEKNSTLNADVWKTAGLFGNATYPLENFSYNNSALVDVIFKHVQETNFRGITGNVSFDSVGIRQVHRLTVYQYRYIDELFQLMEIGNILEDGQNFTFVYLSQVENNLWPGGVIPYDGVPLEQEVAVAIPITVIFSVLAAVGIVFSVVCLAFNFIFKRKKLIQLSSPTLNYLIGGGAIILYIDIYLIVIPTADPSAAVILCNITPWLYALGYSFCYGTILAKMVRVYYILHNPTQKKRYSLQDWHLAIGVLLLVLIDLVILIVYFTVEGVQGSLKATRIPNRENPKDINGVLRIITLYFSYACNSTSRDIFLGILYGYKMMLQIVALVLALSTHEVKVKGLNDAKYIAAAIYVTSIEVAVIIICVYTLSGFVNGFVAVISTVDFLGTTVTLGLVFVTKMVNLYKDPDGKTIFTITDPTNKVIHQSTDQPECSVDVQTVKTLKTRIAELEAAMSHINQTQVKSLKARIAELETALSHMKQAQNPSTEDKLKTSHVSVLNMMPDTGSSHNNTEDTTHDTSI